jgi:stringent starvation protein B
MRRQVGVPRDAVRPERVVSPVAVKATGQLTIEEVVA